MVGGIDRTAIINLEGKVATWLSTLRAVLGMMVDKRRG
jgi:hypothetical protein